MSVIVKGMKMPDSCAVCRFAGRGGYFMERIVCMFTGKNEDAENVDRLPNCPLVALPDRHGRLVDADELKTAFPRCDNNMDVKIASVRATINHMDTIVEAGDALSDDSVDWCRKAMNGKTEDNKHTPCDLCAYKLSTRWKPCGYCPAKRRRTANA